MADKSTIRYPVTYVQEPVEQALSLGDGDSIFNDIQLAETSQCLSLNVTSEQFLLLFSSALNGAQRHFPENWLEIIYPLIEAGKNYCGGTMTCEDIADCIETNQEVQAAIANSNNATGILDPDILTDVTNNYINQRMPENVRNSPIATPPPTCELDALWTGILEIVTRLDEASKDAWQDITAQANKIDRIAEAVAIIPLIAEIPAETIEAFAEIVPDLLAAYEAHSSTEVLEDIACDLFAIVCAECRYPTAQELYSYYATFGVTGIQDMLSYGVDAAVDFLIGSQSLANAVVFFTTNAIQLYFRYLGGTYLGKRGLKWLQIWADVGEDNPNNGWELLCDACGTPEISYVEYDFTNGIPANTTVQAGTWNPDGYLQSTQAGTVQSARIYAQLGQARKIKAVAWEVDRIGCNGGFRCIDAIGLRTGTTYTKTFVQDNRPNGRIERAWSDANVTQNIDNVEVHMQAQDVAQTRLYKFRIYFYQEPLGIPTTEFPEPAQCQGGCDYDF